MGPQLQLLACCVAAALIINACAAKPQEGKAKEWVANLRSMPKPTYDATGHYKTFSKHFTRKDPTTGEYTHLSYNCTFADDHFVDLGVYALSSVTCEGNKVYISSETAEALEELAHAMAHSPTGLLYGGEKWTCLNERGIGPGPIYR